MRFVSPVIVCVAIIGAVLIAGCIGTPEPTLKPNVSTTELRVQYDRPLYADYGTADCFFRDDIPGQTTIAFRSGHCHMSFARFSKTANDTSPGILRVDLVRDGQIIKGYSTGTQGVYFDTIDAFLVRSVQEPGLGQEAPITVKIVTDAGWTGQVSDQFGGQSERRTGLAILTLNQPVPPVRACVRADTAAAPVAVELSRGETLLNRSTVRDVEGETCTTFP